VQKAADKGEDARVLTVLSAGLGGPIDVDDLGLKEGVSLKRKADYTGTYNDMMVEVIVRLTIFSNLSRNLQFAIQNFHLHMPIRDLSTRTLLAVYLSTFVIRTTGDESVPNL
jgi:hypothetical protein